MQEAAVAEVKKGFAAKSQAAFDEARREYLQGIKTLRSDLGLAVEPPTKAQREHETAAGYDKVSTESEWLQDMQRMCRQQAGVILMQQQQRLREQELATAMAAAKVALGGGSNKHGASPPRQRSRQVHPSVKRQR